MRFLFEGMSNDKNKKPEMAFTRCIPTSVYPAGSALAALPFVARVGKQKRVKAPPHKTSLAENIIQTCSTFDCGGKCDIRAHVNDGVVTRISTRPDNELIRKCQ